MTTSRPGVRRRLRALDVLFLVSVVFGIAIYTVAHRPSTFPRLLEPPSYAAAAVLIVVGWFFLSWEREPGVGPRAFAAAWAMVAFVGTLDSFGDGTLCALAVANLVFVWGTVPAAVFVGVIAVGNAVNTVVHRSLTAFDVSLLLYVVIAYSAACVIAEIVRRARDDKRRTEALLAELERAHAELSQQAEQIRELTLTAERARFARDMHDSVGHHLTAVALTLRTALRPPSPTDPDARQEVARALDMVKQALDETRRTVRALQPLPLTHAPLDAVLDSLLAGYRGPGREVTLAVEGGLDTVDPEVATVVYRTAQEGMTNVARHTDARTVEVTLTVGDGVDLTIRDDGTPPTTPPAPGGWGLRGLRERAAALAGTLDAAPGPTGFTLRLRIPARVDAHDDAPAYDAGSAVADRR